jgi:hypothetical protein
MRLYHACRACFAPMLPDLLALRTRRCAAIDPEMVEAPGTAPGSTTLISHTVYRHSRQAGRSNIGGVIGGRKGAPPSNRLRQARA